MGERAREASKKQLPNGISLFFGDGKLQNNKKNGNRKITHDTRHDNLQLNSAGNWLLKYIYIYMFFGRNQEINMAKAKEEEAKSKRHAPSSSN